MRFDKFPDDDDWKLDTIVHLREVIREKDDKIRELTAVLERFSDATIEKCTVDRLTRVQTTSQAPSAQEPEALS